MESLTKLVFKGWRNLETQSLVHLKLTHLAHLLSMQKAQKHDNGLTWSCIKTCLLVARIQWIFWVSSKVLHAKIPELWSTCFDTTCWNAQQISLFFPWLRRLWMIR
jgi:hypothetical protein